MTGIVVRVETDEVAVQDTVEDLVAHWEDTVNLATWEGRMQEEAEFHIALRIADLLAQHSW